VTHERQVLFGLRFDFRNPDLAGTTMADRYAAALDIAEWADRLGCVQIAVSEHHGSSDGYLPSPLPMLAAMAARTTNVRFLVAALIAPFHDPLRLAEDMVVLDNLSRGRVDLVVAGGYVREEFAMFDVPMNQRGRRVTEAVTTLKAAFTGEPFEFRGRTVRVTPAPFRPGGPSISLGGSSEPAARRAARIADGFIPTVPEVWDFYRDEVQKLGRSDPGPSPIGANRVVALAEDPEQGWEQMAPFFLHETNAYGAWQAQDDVAAPFHTVADVGELRATGQYRVLTPGRMVEELQSSPFALLHPLCGGMPIDLAWSSLRLFEHEVMPAFQ
jgi:alkanesulfonate monooxygenase SsuD/methylene tetrahydromethanopterin reductase-like flavin-dependent oxidoreductase (luciferase family)